ncbi:MAG: hypothetical protein IJA85_08410 [Clostridia bacterium]|nr:hypothetical protein [Clostridia bacterium]
MSLIIRRILILTAAFSLTFAAALLLLGAEQMLPPPYPISLVPLSQTFTSLHILGHTYTIDLTIVSEVLAHLRDAAEAAFPLLPMTLR